MQEQSHNRHESEHDIEAQDVQGNLARKISELSDLHLRYTYSNTSSTSEFGLYEQPSSMEQFEKKFIKDQELFQDILAKLTEVKSMLCIEDDDLSLYLLQHYDWSTEKMISFFNEDWSHFKKRAATFRPQQIKQNAIEGVCLICCEETKLYSSGMCNHVYCAECWRGYIKSELQAGRIFFRCMNQQPCRNAPVLKSFVREIAPELVELYRRKICVNYSIQNKDVCYCPNVKCPYFCSKPSLMQLSLINCPCGELYCFKCEQQPHSPATCRDVEKWQSLINSDKINLSWIQNNTRQCPKCKQPIQKKVGCSHMKCICQCQFCYQCNKLWDSAHLQLKSECPNRKQLERKRKLSDKLVDLEDELNRMMKEKDRHQSELRLCQTLVKEEGVHSKVSEVKVEVICAWMSLKWTKILLALENRVSIERDLEKEFVESIRNTMQPVEYIIKNISTMALRDLHHYGEMVLIRKQTLKKNKSVWLQAFEAHSPNAKCLSFSV